MIEIVRAEATDREAIAVLAKEIWEEHFTPLIGEQQVAYMLENFQSVAAITKQVEVEQYTYYKIVEQELIGYIAIQFSSPEAFLSKLYLKKAARGKGYASFALKFLELLCREKGCSTLWLTCNKDNKDTLAKYEKMGFVVFDSVVKDIGNGYVMDDYYLKKNLYSEQP